jgi:hypothetical protein
MLRRRLITVSRLRRRKGHWRRLSVTDDCVLLRRRMMLLLNNRRRRCCYCWSSSMAGDPILNEFSFGETTAAICVDHIE